MKKKLMSSLILFSFFCICIGNINTQQKINGISAIIGDEIVLDSEIIEIAFYKLINEKKQENYCEELEEILKNKLLISQTKKNDFISKNISDEIINLEIKMILENLLKQNSNEKLILQENGCNTIEEFYEKLKKILKNKKYIEEYYQYIIKNTEVSPKDIKNYYNKNKDKLSIIPEKIKLKHIIFYPKLNNKDNQKYIDELNIIINDIKNGVSFESQAIAYSEDPTSSIKGGLIQNIKRGKFIKEFEDIAFNLVEGEISPPFKTKFGFNIVQLVKRNIQEIDIRHILIKPKYTDEEFNKIKKLVHYIKNIIFREKIDLKDIIKTYYKYTKKDLNDYVNYNIIDEDISLDKDILSTTLEKVLINIKNGELTPIYEEKINNIKSYVFTKLIERIPSHKISYENKNDYEYLIDFTKTYKSLKVLKNYINAYIKNTFIKIDDNYEKCPFKYNWIKK